MASGIGKSEIARVVTLYRHRNCLTNLARALVFQRLLRCKAALLYSGAVVALAGSVFADDRATLESVVQGNEVVSQNEDQAFDLGTILLRGELIVRDVQNTTTSVAVATGDELDARGETNLDQLLLWTPGVNFDNGTISIRGVSSAGIGVGGGGDFSGVDDSLS